MPSVILHIGLPRTGTTLLQQWLEAGNSLLASANLFPLSTTVAHRIAVAFIEQQYRERVDVVGIRSQISLEDAYGSVLGVDGIAILSSEYFSSTDPADVAIDFRERGLHVEKIICFIRRQDALQVSSYAQNVRMIGEKEAPVAVGYHEAQDWNLLTSNWARIFPSAVIELRSYDKACKKGLLPAFSECLDLKPAATSGETERVNATMSAEFTEIARMLNVRSIEFDGDRLLSLSDSSRGARFAFAQSEIDIIEAAFRPSNEALAVRFPEEFADFAEPGWTANGVDMTGRVNEERMQEVLTKLQALEGM